MWSHVPEHRDDEEEKDEEEILLDHHLEQGSGQRKESYLYIPCHVNEF